MSQTDPILVPVRLDVDGLAKDIAAMGRRVAGDPIESKVIYRSDISNVVKDIKGLLAKEYAIKWRFDLDMRAASTAIAEFKSKADKVSSVLFLNTASAAKELATFKSNNASLNVSVSAKDLQVSTDITKATTALSKLFSEFGSLEIKTSQDLTAVRSAMASYRTESKAMVTRVEANTAPAVADLEALKTKHGVMRVAVEAKDLEVHTNLSKATLALEKLFKDYGHLAIKASLDLTEIKGKLTAYRAEHNKLTIAVDANTSKAVNQIVAFRNTAKSHVIVVGANTADAVTRLAKLKEASKDFSSSIGIDTGGASKKLQTLTDRFDTLDIKTKADILSAKGSLSQLFTDFKSLAIKIILDQEGARKGVVALFEKAKKLPIAVSLDSAAAFKAIKKMATDFKELASHLTMDTKTVTGKLNALFDKFDQLDIKPKADLSLLRKALGVLFGDYKHLVTIVKLDDEVARKHLTSLRDKFDKLLIVVTADSKAAQVNLAELRARFKNLSIELGIDGAKADKAIRALFSKFKDLEILTKADVVRARETLTKLFKQFGKLVIGVSADTEKAGGSLAATHRKYKVLKLDVTADPKKVEERLEALTGRASTLKLKAELDTTAAAAKIQKIDAQYDRINASIVLDDMQAQAKIAKIVGGARVIEARLDLDTDVAKARISKLQAQTQKIEIQTELKKPNMEFLKGLGSMAANLFQSGFQIVTQLIQGALAGIGGFLKESIKVGNEVDSVVRRGAGLAGGGENAYQKIRENAIRVGAQPNYLVSTKDVAQSTEIYLKAGKNLDQAIAAQTGIAEISTMTGEKATKIASNLLDFQAKFDLSANDQKRSAELFAGLLTSAKLNSKDLANSAKYLTADGNTIKDLENSTKQLALMAKSGIRSTTAATSMGAAMRNLPKIMETIGVSRTNADGSTKSQLQTMLDSRKALIEYQKLNGELKMKDLVLNARDGFGVNGGRAMLDFMKLSDKAITETLGKIDNAAAKMKIISAESLKSTAVGGIAFTNSLETLQVRVSGAIAPAVNGVQLALSAVMNGLTNSPIWSRVAALTTSIAASINSPVLQAALGKVGEFLSLGILKAVQGVELFFRILANPPKFQWLDDLRSGLVAIFGGALDFIAVFTKSIAGAGFGQALMATFRALSSAIGAVFSEIGKTTQAVFSTEGGKEFFTGIGDAAKGAGALIMPLIRLAGETLRLLAPSLGTILGLAGKALSLVGNLAIALGPFLNFVVKGLAIGVAPALKGILFVFTNIIVSPVSVLVNGLTAVKDAIWLVAAGFTKSGDAVYEYATRANDRLNAMYTNIGIYWSGVGKWTASFFGSIGSGLDRLNSAVGSVFVAIGSAVASLFTGTMSSFNGMAAGIAQIYKGIYEAARSAFTGMAQLGQWAVTSIRSLFAGIGVAIGNSFSAAGSAAHNALAYLVNIGKWAVTSIRSLFAGIGAAIGNSFSAAIAGPRNALSNIVKLAQWAVGSVRSVFSGVGASISNAFSGVASGIQRAFSPIYGIVANVRSAMNTLTSSVQGALSNLSRLPSISLPKFAQGGVIGRGRSSTDDQLILAQRGEGIVTHKGMDVLGPDRLALLNAGIKAFAVGGVIGGEAKPAPKGGFTFTIDVTKPIDGLIADLRSIGRELIAATKAGGGNLAQSIGNSIAPSLQAMAATSQIAAQKQGPIYKGLPDGKAAPVPGFSAVDLAKVFKGSNWIPAGKNLQGPNESIFEAAGFSATLVRTLKAFEQFSGTTYKDSEGIDTIGFGSARTSGDPAVLAALKKGRVSVAEANVLMLNHLKKENPIAYIKSKFPNIKSFSEGQIAALVSMYYNGGPGLIASLAKKAQTIPQLANAIPTHWINSGTASEAGLRNRRSVESKLFNAVSNTTANTVPAAIAAGTAKPTAIPKSVTTYLESLKLGLNPTISPALAIELNKLSPGAVTGVPAANKIAVKGVAESKTFVRVTRTGQKDKAGLEILRTDLIKNGLVIDTMFATSGQPYIQKFQAAGQKGQLGAGSYAPIPEGIYKLGSPAKTSGSFGKGLGNTYIDVEGDFGAGRSAIGIHLDANRASSPGSAGCIVFNDQSEIDKMASWVTNSGAKTLVTDWGLGTVTTTGKGAATLRPNPAIIAGLVRSVTGAAPDIVAGTMAVLAPPILGSITDGLDLNGGALAAPILGDMAGTIEDMAGSVTGFTGATDTIGDAALDMSKGVSGLVTELPKIMRYGAILKDASIIDATIGKTLPARDPETGRFISKSSSATASFSPTISPTISPSLSTPAGTDRGSGRKALIEFKLTLPGNNDYGANRSSGGTSEGDRTYDGIRSITNQIETTMNSDRFQSDLIDQLLAALRGDDRLRLVSGL